ncbi:FAD-binding protein [Mycobacterium mantenii]|uniref:2-polyprenyl-6-methoxyphenol hydroxylase-like oxidoreductase n=2 Tax=Mycobacterium mantenii TaxID=560555 RepID=A0A1X0FUC5_MYCNT|nr:FAD-binding protein [Mycobacterium mantenii]MCV7245189.1 FAD-binding protein [Mycobacterium mantenii]ORB05384.1 2-polyprenyl-6-methoxyphenol hydroxylase-like oxidoreductase [Mycobacterium mantenii]
MAKIGNHALVLGASMAGLAAARSLSDFFGTVTVLERDPLPDIPPETAAARRGVPQGRHLHGLLPRGALALEQLFPGVLDQLVIDGAHHLDGRDLSQLYYRLGEHLMVRSGGAPSFDVYLATRPFLEEHVRARLRRMPNVTLLDEHDIVDLTTAPDRRRVTGARAVNRRTRENVTLSADLVLDATGRGARTPAWLTALGYERPAEVHVPVHLTYVSQRLRMAPDALHEFGVVVGVTPGRPYGLGLLRSEHDTCMLTVFGIAGHGPRPDLASMCEFVEDCAPAHLLAAVRAAEPIGETTRHCQPSSQWRRYDRLQRFPEGLLVMGDAICSFNPIYGQGMTVAALEALALRDCLSGGTADLARRFFRAAAVPIRQAWELSANPDLCLPEIEGTPPLLTRLLNAYIERILTATEYDPVAVDRFVRVTALIDPATRLLRPGMMWRAALANRRRPRRGDAQPAGAPSDLVGSVAP